MPVNITFEEQALMGIYNAAGTRQGLIEALAEMQTYISSGEQELLQLTDSALGKLRAMTDADYEALDLSANL